jgi:ABC-type Fe3+-hydroxamate transport system substrate-binding protein
MVAGPARQTVVDALGRSIDVPRRPQRIISLVPSLTEWLFALGLGERVAGVTDFCVQPATGDLGELLRAKPRLRGTKNPDRAAILALEPEIVIANKEENRERDVLALAEAGVAVYVSETNTVAEAIATLATLADLLDASAAAAPYLDEMRATYAELTARPATVAPRVLVPIWRDPWMAIGAQTYADDLLRSCGAHNVAAALDGRYPRFTLDDLPALRPDVALLPSEPYAFAERDRQAVQAALPVAVRFVDGELLTWYGPRLAQALRSFHALLEQLAADVRR